MVAKEDSVLSQKEREWNHLSLQYYLRFQEKEDPEVIIEFMRFSPFALKEKWVVENIMKLWLQGQYHSLQKIFSPKRGGRASENKRAIRNILITDKIDRLVAQGMSKTQAFVHIMTSENDIIGDWNINKDQIKKIYYRTKKKAPQVYVRSHGDFLEVMIHPVRIEVMSDGHSFSAVGLLRMHIKNE